MANEIEITPAMVERAAAVILLYAGEVDGQDQLWAEGLAERVLFAALKEAGAHSEGNEHVRK